MLANREGQKVPQVKFRTREGGDWKDVTTDDVFKGKTVVVFSLPGAFTPTCSSITTSSRRRSSRTASIRSSACPSTTRS